MKRFATIAFVIALASQAFAAHQCYSAIGYPGQSVNNPITALCVDTFPDNGGTATQAKFTWTTPLASNSCVWSSLTLPSSDEADVSRRNCNASSVTSHSITVDGFGPNKGFIFYVTSSTTGGTGNNPAARIDGHMSSSPFGTQTSVYSFQNPDSTGTFDWQGFWVGPHNHLMRGHQYTLTLQQYKTAGAVSSEPKTTVMTALAIDGQNCLPFTIGGNTCGTTDITVQVTCGYNNTPSTSTHNYFQNVFSSGARTGQSWCSWDGTQSGQYGIFHLRLVAGSTASIASHTISPTIVQLDTSGAQVGSSRNPTYTVSIDAAPTFTRTAPATFPAIPNLAAWQANMFGTDVSTGHATIGAVQNYVNFKTANTTLPGIYNNDAGGSTIYTINPWGLETYRGSDQVPLQIMDYLVAVDVGSGDPAFIPTHAYSYGDFICPSGPASCLTGTTTATQMLVVTDKAGCVSGATLGTVPNPGSYSTNGTCHFGNVGNKTFWLEMTERSAIQQRDFLLSLQRYTVAQEWAAFNNVMWCFRSGGCGSSQRDFYAIEYMLYPFLACYPSSCNGAQEWQRSQYSVAREPLSPRSISYDTEAFVAYWLATGTKPVDHGVDEIQFRKDMIIQALNDLLEYSLDDGVNSTLACCQSYPSFDIGLYLEALIDICAAEKLETGTCDAAIPVTIGRVVDWVYSNEYNLLGNNFSQPYTLWSAPFTNGIYNYLQPSLNNLTGPAFAWWWQMNGDSCSLATSGANCRGVADSYFQHTFDNPTGGAISGKENSEWYKWFADFYYWRTGARTPYQLSILPAYNPLTTFPGRMESYPQNAFPAKPTAINIGTTSATIESYTYEQPTSLTMKYGTNPGAINTTATCSPSTITLFNSDAGLYKLDCGVSGLTPSTHYYFGAGEADSAGNQGYTQYDIMVSGHPPFDFSTLAGFNLQITTTSLPDGTKDQAYSGLVQATGGQTPYLWCVIESGGACDDGSGGALPAGLTIGASGNNGLISGTPSAAGTSNFTVRVTDNLSGTATKPLSITITSTQQNNLSLTGNVTVTGNVTLK